MDNIVIAIDFSPLTDALIRQAIGIAQAFGAKLWLIHVAASDPAFVGYEVGPQHVRDLRASELRKEHRDLQHYARQIREQNLDAEALLIDGPLVPALLREAKDLEADLIVVGGHRQSNLFDKLLGTTNQKLVKQSTIPLLIVPEEPDEATGRQDE